MERENGQKWVLPWSREDEKKNQEAEDDVTYCLGLSCSMIKRALRMVGMVVKR